MTEHDTDKPAIEVTDPANLETFEVLTENANGHRTVHRVAATSAAAASKKLEETLDNGVKVIAVDKAGRGLGSGERDIHQGDRINSDNHEAGDKA
jgi:hypothetical protein